MIGLNNYGKINFQDYSHKRIKNQLWLNPKDVQGQPFCNIKLQFVIKTFVLSIFLDPF